MKHILASALILASGCATWHEFWSPATPGSLFTTGHAMRCFKVKGVQVWAEPKSDGFGARGMFPDCPNRAAVAAAIDRSGLYSTDLYQVRISVVPTDTALYCAGHPAHYCTDGWTILVSGFNFEESLTKAFHELLPARLGIRSSEIPMPSPTPRSSIPGWGDPAIVGE